LAFLWAGNGGNKRLEYGDTYYPGIKVGFYFNLEPGRITDLDPIIHFYWLLVKIQVA